jgi:glutamate/tyrosine decarboxylase-like PLP-dependent enzyme
VLTRHPDVHHAAFSLTPDYLAAGDGEAPWPCEHMFELTFGNRALKVWAAIARLGRDGIAELVTRCNRLASLLESRVRAEPDFELLAPASLSVVNFRYRPRDRALDDPALDALNEKISGRSARAAKRTCRRRACGAGRHCVSASCITRMAKTTSSTSCSSSRAWGHRSPLSPDEMRGVGSMVNPCPCSACR